VATNRTGIIFKKCDLSNHKPDSNQRCNSGACQHTCAVPEKCSHAWTLRYSVNGKQVEKSFRDAVHETTGRTIVGSGRKLAADFQLKTTVDKRSGDITFADHGKSGKQNFGEAARTHLARAAIGTNSKLNYSSVYRTHIEPALADRTLAQVANDRDSVLDLLTVKMKDLSHSVRTAARTIIVGTCDEAVEAGRLGKHRLAGIDLKNNGPKKLRVDFVFPTFAQVEMLASGVPNDDSRRAVMGTGICVWLMRGCGLRIEEALAVEKSDFIEDGATLRVMWQASRDGATKQPLKHRKRGEYRDVPVPAWLWEMVKDMPEGPLMPGNGSKLFYRYTTIYARFSRAADAASIPDGFTPHSLRHAYASAMLAGGVQVTELATFLGHRDINTTHSIYGHLLPSASKRAVAALDTEYAEWSKAA
jgi:integrase